MENRVVHLVNQARGREGLPAVECDERLRASARAWSRRMAQLDLLAHVAPDGSTPEDRMRAAGHPSPGAENIARGYGRPETVTGAWMRSPGHRANILRREHLSIGVGVHETPDGIWWTQHFGT